MLEIVRMVTDQLRDPVEGVEAMLATLTADLPTDVIPQFVPYVMDETRDLEVADGHDPPGTPALYVTEDGPLAVEGEVRTNDHRDSLPGAGVALAIRLVEANSNTVEVVQARTYIMRAVVKSLTLLLDNAGGSRVIRNGIELVSCERMEFGRWQEKLGEARVGAALVCLFVYRDHAPY